MEYVFTCGAIILVVASIITNLGSLCVCVCVFVRVCVYYVVCVSYPHIVCSTNRSHARVCMDGDDLHISPRSSFSWRSFFLEYFFVRCALLCVAFSHLLCCHWKLSWY